MGRYITDTGFELYFYIIHHQVIMGNQRHNGYFKFAFSNLHFFSDRPAVFRPEMGKVIHLLSLEHTCSTADSLLQPFQNI